MKSCRDAPADRDDPFPSVDPVPEYARPSVAALLVSVALCGDETAEARLARRLGIPPDQVTK